MQIVATQLQMCTAVAKESAVLSAELRQKRNEVPTLRSFSTKPGLTGVDATKHAQCELADGTHRASGPGECLAVCSQPPAEMHQIVSPPDRDINTIVLDKIIFDQGPEHSSDQPLCNS